MMDTIHSSNFAAEAPAYAQLQREMHDALLTQHPEWILPSGNCPTCDSYDARLAELLTASLATERAHQDKNASKILQRPWSSSANDVYRFSMPAGYTEPRNIIFPEMAPAVP